MTAPVPPLSRRRFCAGAITLACAPLAAAGLVDGWPVPPGTTLDATRFARLSALFDALVPAGEAGMGGAADCCAAWYLDQLLSAFDVDPPRVYAGGPYSGRRGGLDGFSRFQCLTRVEELRWRTYIEGSQGIPEREWNGPVVGIRERYEIGLDALGDDFVALPLLERRARLLDADPGFVALAYEHAVEGSYGDPVYGGNRDGIGWRAIGYEGDRVPQGYTAAQVAGEEG